MVVKNNHYWYAFRPSNTLNGEILIDNKNIKLFKRDEILRFNFASPYVELPKRLTVRPDLEIYGDYMELKI